MYVLCIVSYSAVFERWNVELYFSAAFLAVSVNVSLLARERGLAEDGPGNDMGALFGKGHVYTYFHAIG